MRMVAVNVALCRRRNLLDPTKSIRTYEYADQT
jgi:hypothetical protein